MLEERQLHFFKKKLHFIINRWRCFKSKWYPLNSTKQILVKFKFNWVYRQVNISGVSLSVPRVNMFPRISYRLLTKFFVLFFMWTQFNFIDDNLLYILKTYSHIQYFYDETRSHLYVDSMNYISVIKLEDRPF